MRTRCVYIFTGFCCGFGCTAVMVSAFITVLDQGIYPLEPGSIGMQFFIDVENGHHVSSCRVNSWPKICCLADKPYRDCGTDIIQGDVVELVKPKDRETLVYVYPTLFQYDQVGYCDFVVAYKCGNSKRPKEINVHVPFDTQMVNKKKSHCLKAYAGRKISDCATLDEDPLRQCDAINCDLKYSGRRPFYEVTSNKCMSAPVCETDVMKDLPDIAYVPKSNICRDLEHPITIGDIYAINTGLGIVTESTKADANNMKLLMKSNCSTISQNVVLLRDMMYGKLCPMYSGDTSGFQDCCKNAIFSICAYVGAICALLLSLVCCLHTVIWCYMKWSRGELKQSFIKLIPKGHRPKQPVHKPSNINREVTDNLLREVIVRDLPVEMRDSVVDICHRIDHEIKQKRRYRVKDLGSQINLKEYVSDSSSDMSSHTSLGYDDERTKLMKRVD